MRLLKAIGASPALTGAASPAYPAHVAPHWAAGSDSLNYRARKRSSEALFLRPQFMAGAMGALSGARLLCGRPVSSVAPATFSRLTADGGGSQHTEELHHV